MRRLLITGARGFVGRHCIVPAVEAGFEVYALASSAEIPSDLKRAEVAWRVGDLLEDGVIEALIEQIRPSHLLHTAWITKHGAYWTSAENLRWLAAGARMAAAFAVMGGQRVVSVGSCAEYDWTQGPMQEGVTPEHPATFYGAMKLSHASMLQSAAHQFGFSAVTGRIFFAYGPHENRERIVPYACRHLNAGKEARFSSGRQVRDFCYVTDVARGLVSLLSSEIRGACNICTAEPVRLAEIVTTLGRLSGREDLVKLGALQDRPDDGFELVGHNALLRKTGWRPEVSLEQGLQLSLDWWRGGAVP